jgi:hypothetical protein
MITPLYLTEMLVAYRDRQKQDEARRRVASNDDPEPRASRLA